MKPSDAPAGVEGRPSRAARIALTIVLLASLGGFGGLLHGHYPIPDWLFVRYAACCVFALFFAAACFSSGHLLVTRVLRGHVLPIYEHLAVSFAAGVYVFFVGMFVGGLLGLYGGIFFAALPVLLIAVGLRSSSRYVRRAVRHLGGAYRRSPRPPVWGFFFHAFGLMGLCAIYFTILTPNNTAFDSRWQHLGIAEHYAVLGAVRRFPEGWYIGAAPHLASLLYTWAFLLPRAGIAVRIELAAHLELTVFVVGLVGIPALVRRLVPPRTLGTTAHRYAWAARFLFPGVLLYDSSLCLGADQIASVFAVPIYLLLLRTWRHLSPRTAALLSLAMTGALLTKYTGALLLVAPALLMVPARAVWLLIQELRGRAEVRRAWLLGPLAALVTGVVAFAPHWLKNLLWYGDPFYPMLHALLRPRPWNADSPARFDLGMMNLLWQPERSLKGIGKTLGAMFSFSFAPNDWEKFHGHTPVFGSLFTLSLAMLPFLRPTRRLFGLFGAVHLGIFIWYWTHHQDRYLQAALPLMTAATATVLALAWKNGRPVRLAAGALVGVQVIWGLDVYFMPGHAFLGVPAKAVLDIVSRTPGKPSKDRIAYADAFVAIGRALPPHAKLLVHEHHPHLGVNALTVTDCPYHQGGISYARTPEPLQVYQQLHAYGVTHLLYRTSSAREPDTLAGEIVFFEFVHRCAQKPRPVEGFQIAAMPATAPAPGGAPDPVLVLSCNKGRPASGLYHLSDLALPALQRRKAASWTGVPGKPAPKPFRPAGSDAAALVPEAAVIAVEQGCSTRASGMETRFVKVGARDPYSIWVRK